MSVGFGDPAAFLRVAGEGFGVDALRGEDRQRAGFGTVAGAMLADVGVGGGALGWCAEAESAGHAGLQQWGVFPVPAAGDVGQRQVDAARDRGAGLLLGQVEGARSYSARTVVSNSRP